MFEGEILTILGDVEVEFLCRFRHALRHVPEDNLESIVIGNIEQVRGYHGSIRVVLNAHGALARMDVIPFVFYKFGISTRVNPVIQVAFTGAVLFLEAIKTNSLPYRSSVGS